MDNYQHDSNCLALEKVLDGDSEDPINLPFLFLEAITNKLSEDRLIGSGGFGDVYKGDIRSRMVAVKKLRNNVDILDENFQREIHCLRGIKHTSIVRFLGHCSDTQKVPCLHDGRSIVAEMRQRLFCFEYLSNGSLDKYLTGAASGLRWRVRYKIIMGICKGLGYLHQNGIIHMDLKPQNILLDDSMEPKIADFGQSRLLDGNQTRTVMTKSLAWTPGYTAPEFLSDGKFSKKSDIYSLGVLIIYILTGRKECRNVLEVLEIWRDTIGTSEDLALLHQAEVCAEIAIHCMDHSRNKRPRIDDIIQRLDEIDTSYPFLLRDMRGKPKIKGVSMTEWFTSEQIKEHIDSLRLWVGQSKAKSEKNQAIGHSENKNSCQLCRVGKLTFEPPPVYCSHCGAQIKRNSPYYAVGTGDTGHNFCIPCYSQSCDEIIEVEGQAFLKANLEERNVEETEEWWVQCNKCECWQHQICALVNGRRKAGGRAEYTCPNCYVEEVKCGLRMPLPQSAIIGAKDLPRTVLSDHIEDRLFKRLKQEKQDRAAAAGKNIDEIPGVEGLVVRVVSSVDKKLEVRPCFLEIFQDKYPAEFPYKSKAVLLFQKIEGVEVCLFGMYVQEFGADCSFPNQRRVYLSYLDSIEYFRPEIGTVSGEALSTFVYHEILIGYLDHCKLRGFTSCHIWACPPLNSEDCILYCHPEIQKTLKSDELREWYLSMLQKASKEKIVVGLTNLYDDFFITMGECKAKVTASRLPYFDGDYWPGAAEDMINQLQQEDDHKLPKSEASKILTKRAHKTADVTDLSGNASKDAMLMQKLGETIYPMREDFIIVHLQYSCSHCCILMVSGKRWVCHQCRSFYICDKCYDTEQQLEHRERHPSNSRDTHTLHPVKIYGVPKDTKDIDDIIESEFFDTRSTFVNFCKGNNYQYDMLRRAKHSSMMVLYLLHNPTALVIVTTCNVCCHDIDIGARQGWQCEICPDFDVCNSCFQKGAVTHPHKLINHPSAADRDAQNIEARQMRVQQLRNTLYLLVHASNCPSRSCQYPICQKVKRLFRHAIQCKTRASGRCTLCMKMWYMLQLHSRACNDSDCNVPRCRDLKEHLRRLQQQSDFRRRAAINEIMRQRAAEVAANE